MAELRSIAVGRSNVSAAVNLSKSRRADIPLWTLAANLRRSAAGTQSHNEFSHTVDQTSVGSRFWFRSRPDDQ